MSIVIVTAALLVDQIRQFIEREDPGRYELTDPREVRLRLDQVTNDMAAAGLFENMRQGDKLVSDHYVATFRNMEVLFDKDLKLFYVKLPARYLALPHDKGIDFVGRDFSAPFIPIRRGAMAIFASSPAGRIVGRVGCWPEDNRIYLTKEVKGPLIVRLVIVDSSQVADDAPYPIDPGRESELVERTAAWFLSKKAEVPQS